MGSILGTPKRKLICGHIAGVIVLLALIAGYGVRKFIGDYDNPPVSDDGCKTYPLRGPEDITPAGPTTALISSDDRENWLIHENIEQTGVDQGKLVLLKNMGTSVTADGFEPEYEDLLPNSGFPEGIDFHPHGMAMTPDWVDAENK